MLLRLLTELEAQAERAASDFDAALLTGDQATRAVAALSRVEKIAAGLRTLAAGRVADTAAWKQDSGAASSAHWLARQTGTSVAEAVKDLQTSERLHHLPATQKALRHGELSTRQAHLVADAAAADPTAEGGLLSVAATASLKELEAEAVRTRAAAEPDEMARHRAIRRSRFFRHRTGTDGAWTATMRATTDDAAVLLAAIAQLRPLVFNRARRNGERSPADAYDLDALVELGRRQLDPRPPGDEQSRTLGPEHRTAAAAPSGAGAGAAPVSDARQGEPSEAGTASSSVAGRSGQKARRSSGSRAATVVRIDHAALLRGHLDGGELCEITGVGPIPVAFVRSLIGSAFLAAASVDGTGEVRTVAHLGRNPTLARAVRAFLGLSPSPPPSGGQPPPSGGQPPPLPPPAGGDLPARPEQSQPSIDWSNGTRDAARGQPLLRASNLPPGAALGMGPSTKIIVRVPQAALDAGSASAQHHPGNDHATSHSPSPLAAGSEAMPPAVPLAPVALGVDPIIEALRTNGVDVATLAHGSRKFRAHQRSALELRDHTCSVLGCATTARLEIDHRDDWARTHHTATTDADRYCHFHHALKTRHHWRLEPGTGKRRMLPPSGLDAL